MTATYNVHEGLAGWSNATYSVGARRSNAGNAYQVTTAGTSTSPPTGTGTGINNGGTSVWKYLSGIDYTSLQAWNDGTAGTLSQPYLVYWWNDGLLTATSHTISFANIHGHTTTSTNTITIMPPPGDGFAAVYQATPTTAYIYNSANGKSVEFPASGSGAINYIQVGDNWVIIDGIQFKDPNSGSGCSIIGGPGTNVTIRNCILDGWSQSGGACLVGITGVNLSLLNNLFVARNTSASTAIVATSGGSGAKVANNIFYHTTLLATQRVLDSGSNATTSSMTATNNIYINYSIIYACTTGGAHPWLNSYCAFTAASFSASNNGTDSGNSIYGVTPSAIFANYPSDFNPKSGASTTNSGFTDTADIPSATDAFGTSRPQATSWDMGPVERRSAPISVQRDFPIVLEVKAGFPSLPNPWSSDFSSDFGIGPYTIDRPILLDWKATVGGNASVPAEWSATVQLLPVTATGIIPLEILQSVPISVAVIPVEWRGGAITPARDFAIPLEFKSSAQVDSTVALEVKTGFPSLTYPWPADFSSDFWSSDFLTEADIGPYTIDRPILLDWRATVGKSASVPLEYLESIGRSAEIPAAFGYSIQGTASPPLEWSGSAIVTANASIGLEWRSSVASSSSVPIEWGVVLPLVSRDAEIFLEWRSSVISDAIASAEWRSPVSANAQVPVSFAKTFVIDAQFPVAFGLTALADAIHWIETRATIQQDTPISMDSAHMLSVSATIPQETNTSVQADTNFPAAIEGSVFASGTLLLEFAGGVQTGASGNIPLEFGRDTTQSAIFPISVLAGAAASAAVQVEWGHLTLSISASAQIPLEIKSTVIADFSIELDAGLGVKTIGSRLRPDEWEKEHR